MEKDTIIKIALSAVLAVYLVFALALTGNAERADHYSGLDIHVADSLGTNFVTADDIARECSDVFNEINTMAKADIDLNRLEQRLCGLPVVEHANVSSLNDGRLRIDIEPLLPVARVFTPMGDSYYINSSGKRVMATARYHVDVPIVAGDFDSRHISPADLLPMLSYIAGDPTANALVSTVALDKNGDIIVVPVIRGQIINMGDTADISGKFDRLKTFYAKVMPIKGWNTYDTISVKWAGQIVASRRDKTLGNPYLNTEDEVFDLIDDAETMLTDEDGYIDEDSIKTISTTT